MHRLQDSFFRAIFDSAVAGIAVADLNARAIVAANPELLRIVGRRREDIEGVADAWREMTPSEYHHLDERAIAQFLGTGRSETFEKEYVRPDGSRVPVRVSTSGIEGEPGMLLVLVQDITEERAAREREQQVRQRLEIALSAADQGVWDWDLVTNEMVYDARARQIYGIEPGERVSYEIVRDRTHPEDLPNTTALLKRAIDPAIRDRSDYEYRISLPDGSIRWALAHGEAVFEGNPPQAIRYVGTLQDVTKRKAGERLQQILVAELNHRVKNTLAIVQALAHQTFKGQDAGPAVETFSGRLAALAAAHAILTESSWESAEVREIAEAVLAPILGRNSHQVELSGGIASLPPQTAVNVAMALHELATNAVKYGSLSTPGGRVLLKWALSGDDERRLALCWREEGGPLVEVPAREGFGTRMLRRILTSEIDGKVTLDFKPSGLECLIEAPVRVPDPLI